MGSQSGSSRKVRTSSTVASGRGVVLRRHLSTSISVRLCEYPCAVAITIERLREFMRLHEDEFKERLSEDEAREIACRLVELYHLLAAPLPSEVTKRPPEGGPEGRVRDRA